MLIIQVDNVKKQNRKKFKHDLLNIDGKISVAFADENARIEVRGPYIVTEDSLIEKSRVKKAVYKYITDFRFYQFNQS